MTNENTPATNRKPSLTAIVLIVFLVLVLLFGWFVWPGLNIYTSATLNNNKIPIRINRITGTTSHYLVHRGWVIHESESSIKPVVGTVGWLEGKWTFTNREDVFNLHQQVVGQWAEMEEAGDGHLVPDLELGSDAFYEKYPLPNMYMAEFSNGTVKFTKMGTLTGEINGVEDGIYHVRDGRLHFKHFDLRRFYGKGELEVDAFHVRMYNMSEDSFSISTRPDERPSGLPASASYIKFTRR